MKKFITTMIGVPTLLLAMTAVVFAVTGDLLGTVVLPGNGTCSVAGTFDGKYYMTINTNTCVGTTIGVYQPPVGGNGAAVLVSSKNIVDAANNPVSISALAWDPSRTKLWGAYNDQLYLIDAGDPTQSTDAVATFQFNAGVGGISLVDGLAYDGSDDTVYYSPDVSCDVYHFSPAGALLNTVTPKDANGNADCRISGVVVGSGNTLYIGRDGAAEIRRVDKTTGVFISQFATTSGRVEDLTCDPVTYAPKEAILAKDAYNGLYEAFEVEAGTCPLQGEPEPVVGRMTGGGTIPAGKRVTLEGKHGFELHCDASDVPNRLEVNWGKGNKFHLETLDSAVCSDDPAIEPNPPVAGFDTYVGKGTGRLNGVSGATARWEFRDAGEPGKNDYATIVITDGVDTYTFTGNLQNGNHQAHK